VAKPTVRYVVSVVARDRVGIIAAVSEALYALGGNLEALSQTVVWHWFTMIICGVFPEGVTATAIKESIEASGDMSATVLPFGPETAPAPAEGDPFVVTAFGEDKPGIVRSLTRCFAEKGINIDDVWNEVRKGQFIIIFHVTVPPDVDPKDARHALEQVAEEAGVRITLQHQDIFTATNSLEVHTKR
jgi:glycine cleavage system transcriptional repressor